jgi:hypothetical protein
VLVAKGFGFQIPTGASIKGVEVGIRRRSSHSQTYDAQMLLVKGNVILSHDLGSGDSWPTSYAVATYGSPTDLWGTKSLDAATLNSPSFALTTAAYVYEVSDVVTARIDAISITVHYCTN